MGKAVLLMAGMLRAWGAWISLAAAAWAQDAKPPAAEPKPQEPAKAAPAAVEPAPPVPAAEPSWGEQLFGISIHGSLATRYRLRWTDTDHDQDLYETLSVTVGDPARDAVTGYLLGRAAEDLDGRGDKGQFFVFDSLQDTYERPVTAQLYEAYVDVHRLGPVERVRGGRQTLYETPVVVYFDGGRVETAELTDLKFRVDVYGGVPVHFYESSPDGDLMGGAAVQARPWEGGRLRADWMHVNDENTFGKNNNDLWGFAAWQDLFERVQLHALYTRLEEKSRDLLLRGTYREAEADLMVQASFYRLLETQREYAIEFDPFFNAAFEYRPYYQARGLVSKGFGEWLVADAGVEVRRLWGSGEEGPFNHDFERYFVTPSLRDIPLKGLSISLTGEFWNGEDDIWTWGADATYKINSDVKASVGSYYSLYKFDYYGNRERDDVRTIYARIRWKVLKSLRVDGGYEYEHGDLDTIQTVRLGLTWDF